jgi:transglutaminase-like putative cysteine protease
MRIRISHQTLYRYDQPAIGVIQTLRLTPRNHAGQYVVDWRIDISEDCRLDHHEDAFGNITHTFTADGPLSDFRVTVDGEVDTQDTAGIVRGTVERFPPSLYLRETALTQPDAAILDFAREIAARSAAGGTLNVMHQLLAAIHGEMTFDADPTHAATTAAESFSLKRGVCQDLTHVFVAAARSLGVPARYISGYVHSADGTAGESAGHAWAEAFIAEIGWVGFDPAHCISPTEAHVRVAAGLDYLGAAPVRGTRYGGGAEALVVQVRVTQAARQVQS